MKDKAKELAAGPAPAARVTRPVRIINGISGGAVDKTRYIPASNARDILAVHRSSVAGRLRLTGVEMRGVDSVEEVEMALKVDVAGSGVGAIKYGLARRIATIH
jgi:hypothetical protein